MLLEAERNAFGAFGRNGGFCAASLGHGVGNGLGRWPEEMDVLDGRRRRPCRIRDTVAAPHRFRWEDTADRRRSRATRSPGSPRRRSSCGASAGKSSCSTPRRCGAVDSPMYLGGCGPATRIRSDPPRLCSGIARAAEAAGAGVRRAPGHRARDGRRRRAGRRGGRPVPPPRALAAGEFPPLVRASRRDAVPGDDYVLVPEPLLEAERDAIGWRGREGLSDVSNEFDYHRETDDHRNLFRRLRRRPTTLAAPSRPTGSTAATFALLAGENSPPRSHSSRACALDGINGAARSHLQPLLGAVGDWACAAAPRTGRFHRPGVGASRSARALGSTCSTVSTRSDAAGDGAPPSAAVPPSGGAGRHPATRRALASPTARRGGAGRGRGCSTGSASVRLLSGYIARRMAPRSSTARRSPRRSAARWPPRWPRG